MQKYKVKLPQLIILVITSSDPIHLPKIKPPKIAIGDPKPAAQTQTIVNKTNNTDNKNKLLFSQSKKVISIIFYKIITSDLLNTKFRKKIKQENTNQVLNKINL